MRFQCHICDLVEKESRYVWKTAEPIVFLILCVIKLFWIVNVLCNLSICVNHPLIHEIFSNKVRFHMEFTIQIEIISIIFLCSNFHFMFLTFLSILFLSLMFISTFFFNCNCKVFGIPFYARWKKSFTKSVWRLKEHWQNEMFT